MSVRSPYDFLWSPYDSRTMLGVRPSFVYYQTNLERNKSYALNDRIVQFFEDRPYFYDICLLSRKIPVPVGNGTDFSSCDPLKTHSDHEILLLMVFPLSGTYF